MGGIIALLFLSGLSHILEVSKRDNDKEMGRRKRFKNKNKNLNNGDGGNRNKSSVDKMTTQDVYNCLRIKPRGFVAKEGYSSKVLVTKIISSKQVIVFDSKRMKVVDIGDLKFIKGVTPEIDVTQGVE